MLAFPRNRRITKTYLTAGGRYGQKDVVTVATETRHDARAVAIEGFIIGCMAQADAQGRVTTAHLSSRFSDLLIDLKMRSAFKLPLPLYQLYQELERHEREGGTQPFYFSDIAEAAEAAQNE